VCVCVADSAKLPDDYRWAKRFLSTL